MLLSNCNLLRGPAGVSCQACNAITQERCGLGRKYAAQNNMRDLEIHLPVVLILYMRQGGVLTDGWTLTCEFEYCAKV